MSTQGVKLKSIADAIRAKEESTAPIPANDFASRILALPSGLPDDMCAISVEPSDPEGGSVSGGGVASAGMTVTVSAEAADHYVFKGWQENGEPVSFDAEYTFPVEADRNLVAVVGNAPSRLPAGYTEVAYVQADTKDSGFKIDVAPWSDSVVDGIFELTQWSTFSYLMIYLPNGTDMMRLHTNGNNLYARYSNKSAQEISIAANNAVFPYEIKFNADLSASPKTLICNGQSVDCTWTYTYTYYSLYLGRGSSSSSYPTAVGARIKYLKMSSAAHPAGNAKYSNYNCELIPCITPEGTAALYDLTNTKVYTPNSGSFTAGPAV